jgi:steroid 5-alpha reductase family enzyme
MFFLDRHEFSAAPKCLFLAAMLVALSAAFLMIVPFAGSVPAWLEPYRLEGDAFRRGLVLFALGFYVLRLMFTTLVFLKRKLIWGEAVAITALMTVVLVAYARAGGANPQPVGLVEILGLILYIAGSYLNTASEAQRQRAKSAPDGAGRLFTGGLFALARHINYFGDVVLFAGLALLTGRLSLLVIPVAMAINFLAFIIPRKEAYMAKKYGADFTDYAARTRKLIPFVY